MNNKCYICGGPVEWVNDNDAVSEYGLSDEGIVHEYHCPSCGAVITVFEKATGTAE